MMIALVMKFIYGRMMSLATVVLFLFLGYLDVFILHSQQDVRENIPAHGRRMGSCHHISFPL